MSFNVELSDRSSVEKEINIKIESKAFDSKYQSELSSIASRAHIKGFRQGHAPKAMIAKMYGDQIHNDILSKFVNEALQKTAKENDLMVVGTSDFSFDKAEGEEPISVKMILSLYPEPEITIPDGLNVEYPVTPFKEEDIAARIDNIADMFAEKVEIEDRTNVVDGDVVTISYVGEVEGKEQEELKGESVELEMGKMQLPEDIEKALIGMNIGETREVLHTMQKPQPSAENTEEGDSAPVNNEVLFKITLEKIQKKNTPEINDEFAKKTGVADDIEGLKSFIEKDMKRALYQKNRESRDTALIDAVVNANEFEIPVALIDREIRMILAEMRILDSSKEGFENEPVEQYRELLKEQANERVKRGVVIETLIKDLEVKSDADDVETMLDTISKEIPLERQDFEKAYGYPTEMKSLIRVASIRKVTDAIADKASITEKPADESVV